MTAVPHNLDGYSKAIGWLKVMLPLVGLGILSTLFLFAREARVERGVVGTESFAPDGGVESMASPRYTGVTADGASVSVTADIAWPRAGEPGNIDAVQVSARFDTRNGERIDIRSDRGAFLPERDLLELRGGVVVATASGWTLHGEALDARTDWTRISSAAPVRGEGPIGTLDAGTMLIHRDTAQAGSYLMEFDGGVHLVYRP